MEKCFYPNCRKPMVQRVNGLYTCDFHFDAAVVKTRMVGWSEIKPGERTLMDFER